MLKKPDYIRTDEINSFAHRTLTKRFPLIVQSVIENNKFSDEISDKLKSLLRQIPDAELRPLADSSEVNRAINAGIQSGKYRWNNAPFIFVENYLYHLLGEICDYSGNKHDYFAYKKNNDVLSKQDVLIKAIEDFEIFAGSEILESARPVLYSCLTGNTADLSQEKTLNKNTMNLLIDDSEKIMNSISGLSQIDIVLDNSGEELLYDILFSYWVLKKSKAATVNLHFKTFPYFVSDAMKSDFYFLLDVLSKNKKGKQFSTVIQDYIAKGNIVLHEDAFWTDTDDFLSFPKKIKQIFLKSSLIVFKGDLNYRKLVEDRHWHYDTDTKKLIGHIHNNCLIMRVLKSEIITSLDTVPETSNREWMHNGKYGIIQLVEQKTKTINSYNCGSI